jgi:hypothetical protein
MNKKAISEHVMMWIPRMIFLTIVVFTVIFFTRFIVAVYIETADSQADVYIGKMMFEKNGIIRYENDRAYAGVIDLQNFNEPRLNQSMKFDSGEEGPCAMLSLKNMETGQKYTAYWNKLWYERLKPRVSFIGIGSPYEKKVEVLVTIYQDSKYIPAMLSIDMVVPKK